MRDAARVSEGPGRLHDRKGDRRQVVPSPSPRPRYAELPFNPDASEHATHVAGIAAGNHGTQIPLGGGRVTLGVAPRAYLGNYRVLTVPTVSNVGLDGNRPRSPQRSKPCRTAWT